MATLRDIKRRIISVRNTRQITSAMKMVATAKLNRAQHRARSAQPFAEKLRQMVIDLSSGLTGDDHPLFQTHTGGKSVVIVFTSDRGLCGAFNTNLNRKVLEHLNKNKEALPDVELVTVGRVGNDFFKKRGFKIRQSILYQKESERADSVRTLGQKLSEAFITGEVGRVLVAYNHFNNPINQEPKILPLLPIAPPQSGQNESKAAGPKDMIFEPSRKEILDVLLPRYIQNQCFQAHLNTEAGEHGARMVAMDGATRNAGQMIDRLTLQYNRVRQAAITKELIEIVNGAQAL